MADFCAQCTFEILAEMPDLNDMTGEGDRLVLCEGCGPIVVDSDGFCVSPGDCFSQHDIGREPTATEPDAMCYTLPDGECVRPSCRLHNEE